MKGRGWPALAGCAVLSAYAITLARTVTRWDAGEFLAAVHSLGIPHPPGTPLYILAARAWTVLSWPLPFAIRVNLFSAVCAAAAVTLLGILVSRWMRDPLAGAAATLCAGGTGTLWLAATEAEVYAPALLVGIILVWLADSSRSADVRVLALLAFIAGIGWTLHPAALVLLPAAAILLLYRESLRLEVRSQRGMRDGRRGGPRGSRRSVALIAAAALTGISGVLYLYIRAQHDPAINQGNPSSIPALWDVITRAQYASQGIWPRQAPLWLQLANWFEYADWQFALGLEPEAPPSWRRTPFTIAFAVLGVIGFVWHRATDRRTWSALVTGFLAATVGLVIYLNLKAGPTFGEGILPSGAAREARERDYFFVASFALWGAWSGMGAVRIARWIGGRLSDGTLPPGMALAGAIGASSAPLLLNLGYVYEERAVASREVRSEALATLEPLPPRAVLLALGDNDTYPLWYLQEVEGVRPDVAVVTVPLLAVRWYRDEIARRHRLMGPSGRFLGTSTAVREVCMLAAAQSRTVVLTPFATPGTLAIECPEARPFARPNNTR